MCGFVMGKMKASQKSSHLGVKEVILGSLYKVGLRFQNCNWTWHPMEDTVIPFLTGLPSWVVLYSCNKKLKIGACFSMSQKTYPYAFLLPSPHALDRGHSPS